MTIRILIYIVLCCPWQRQREGYWYDDLACIYVYLRGLNKLLKVYLCQTRSNILRCNGVSFAITLVSLGIYKDVSHIRSSMSGAWENTQNNCSFEKCAQVIKFVIKLTFEITVSNTISFLEMKNGASFPTPQSLQLLQAFQASLCEAANLTLQLHNAHCSFSISSDEEERNAFLCIGW